MRILVLGGDGFCGWPTSLALSAAGHEVTIVDSGIRREFDVELGVSSLTPILPLKERIQAWHEVSGHRLGMAELDCHDYERLHACLAETAPEAVIHFAEQRAAPYSMKSFRLRRYTVANNVGVTHNLLCALVELGLDTHVVHLGTMGVYGYGTPGVKLPEGYLQVKMPTGDEWDTREIRFPDDPGSIYHMTKSLDQILFAFYNKNDKVRVTDLHQGIVWGTQTRETRLDSRLINRFDYDGDFGTVLNRFIVEAVVGHPLTVHGSGGQMRAFINIQDTVRCIQLALETPPERGSRVRILNQMTEVHRVLELAEKVAALTGAQIQHLPNPRKEAENNLLRVENRTFLELGLEPTRVTPETLSEGLALARTYRERCRVERIPAKSLW
jgi:UDP-sulfoquinovose synthase